jgi:hypothetical protein
VPHTAEIVVENLDADKRPLAATADFHELFHVVSVTIREDPSTAVELACAAPTRPRPRPSSATTRSSTCWWTPSS